MVDGGWGMGSEEWPLLVGGTMLMVVKLRPDGVEAARYPGIVLDAAIPEPWVLVESTWTNHPMEMDGLALDTGDTLHEFFSPAHPLNLFSVFSPEGRLRGWYANVTHPATLDPRTDPPSLFWHDLYLDVVALPDGSVAVRDQDELIASGLSTSNPELHATILTARDELLARFAERAFPFHETP